MPAPISFVPFGPWGFDPSTGAPQRQSFQDASFFTWGPAPWSATVPNTIDGAINVPFVANIFDDTGSLFPDCQLGAANTAMAVRNIYDTWGVV